MLPCGAHNRRGIGWLLTLALLVLTLPSGASWQCLDGTPCPHDCPMPHGTQTPSVAVSTTTQASTCIHCTACPSNAAISLPQTPGKSTNCTTSQCVLRVSEQPVSVVQSGVEIPAPLLALPPPPVVVCPVNVASTSNFTPYLCFYPQRFLRPFSGRAPPVLL